MFTTESGVTPATPLIVRDANNKVFNIKEGFSLMFLCCKGTDNDFFEQSSFIRKLSITTKRNKC